MLTNYDAKAVAELMGIGFLRTTDNASRQTVAVGKGSCVASPVSADVGKTDFRLGDHLVQVVENMTKGSHGKTNKVSAGSNPSHPSKQQTFCAPSSILIEKAVETGLPRHVLRRIAEHLAGADKTKIPALEWGVVPKSTLERRSEQLSPQESERTERVARLFVHAHRALGTEAEARDFITTPHPELDGRSPMDASKTDLGTRRTEQILNALEYGLAI